MLNVQGDLNDSQGNQYVGHQVLAAFVQKAALGETGGADDASTNGTAQLWQPAEQRAAVAADGAFVLALPGLDQLNTQEPLRLRVLAPDGEVLIRREYDLDGLPAEITISVDAKVFFEIEPVEDPLLGRQVKLTGRALDAAGERRVANTQVILWARLGDAGADDFRPVLATRTDPEGYFSGDYPAGEYAEAYGVVNVGDNEQVPIRLENGTFPKSVVLVVEVPPDFSEEGGGQIPRAPDSEELTRASSTYSEDLAGGQCVSFTVPNRTLEEFSFYTVVRTTEPEIRGLTLTEPNRIQGQVLAKVLGLQTGTPAPVTPAARALLANGAERETNLFPQGPDDPDPGELLGKLRPLSPTVLKAVASDPDRFTPTALMTTERYTTFRDMTSLLDLFKKSVPGRAPLTVENPVDWDDEPTFYQATTIAHGHILNFKQVFKADGYSLGDLLYSLPLAPCQKKQIAVIDWDRQEAAARTERLEEEERLAAMVSRDRDISEIVRSTLTESVRGGSEASTWAVGGGFGLGFIAPPVAGLLGVAGGGGGASSSAWQNSSRGLAANSLQQLRDRTMQSASAVRSQRSTVVQTVRQGESMRVQTEVVANHNHCHSMTMEYFEVLRHLQVKQELTDVQECLFVPLLMSKFDPTKALRWREPLGAFLRNRALGGGFAAIERLQNNYEGSDLPTGRYSQETVEYLDGELRISFQLSRPTDKADGAFEEANWQLYAPFLWTSPLAVYNQYLSGRVQAERDRIFQANVAPRIAETFVQNLKFHLVGSTGEAEVKLDPTLVSNYAPNTPLYVSLRPADAVPAVTREWVTRLRISTNTPLPQYSKAVLHSGSMRYRTKHMSHFLFRDWGIMNDLVPGDPVTIPTYLDRQELRNPREEDKELAKRLLAHLNEHIEHYHKAVWWGMDAERRYMLLDGFMAPNANGRSVASVVENRLIGIVGNCLVMPVARGFHLDPTYRQNAENPVDLLHHYVPTTPAPPMRVSVPTRGVFGEAVMGSCNSCEVKDDTRFWRFEESPCGDEPAPISGVSAESRRSEPPDLEAKDFPTPMINLQNAPAAPDPTGLAAAMQLLGNPNLFRDITGLTENQKNALAALQASFDAAKFFGGEASKLVQQQALTKDIDKTLQTIQKAEKAGLITDEQASKLTNSALQGMVGEDRETEKNLTDEPEVKNLINAASSDGGTSDVALTRPGESVEVKRTTPGEGAGVSFDYNVPGVVPVIAQPSNMTCWATVATMMLSWRDQTSYTIEQAMDLAGPPYKAKFKANQGLSSAEKEPFLTAVGMVGEPPMNYSVVGFRDLLQTYGPIWATTDEKPGAGFSIHARIVTGMFGDGTVDGTSLRIVDPAGGRQYNEVFRTFAQKFEEEAKDSASASLRIQIVHFAQFLPGEGTGGTSDPAILSGAEWVSKFRGSKDVSDLEPTFQAKVQQFIGAMEDAGATVSISSTYRPPERAYLMHWAWRIVKENYDAQNVPAMEGVNINWWHGNATQSKKAAQDMVDGYGLNNLSVAPSLTSRHIERKAIDMQVSWTGNLKIKNADGSEKTITSSPKDEINPDLIAVGQTYGVIHFVPADKDKPHWSTDGR